MASRTFHDRAGVLWTVWDVVPGTHAGTTRQLTTLPEGMGEGWLCFESRAGKRRLYPIPAGWEELPDDRLDLLCRAADAVGRARISEPEPAAPGDEPLEPEPALD